MKETTLNGQSADIVAENVEKLRQLFPEVFCEDSIDFEKLQAVLGEYTDDDQERYNFTWWGKSRALRLAQTPSTGTLRPCREESRDWDTTGNLYIEGDNLEVLKLLQKAYHGKIKMIYIDPPYNTGGDFVYPDDYKDNLQNYLELTGQVDGEGRKISTNREASGRYHTNWLNMMYPRLRLARNLLRDDGVIFISIDENEIENLKKICLEIFGPENFITTISWQKIHSLKNDAKYFSENIEYLLVLGKYKEKVEIGLLPRTDEMNSRYQNPDNDPRGPWSSGDLVANEERSGGYFDVQGPKGDIFNVPKGKHWVYSRDNLMEMIENNRIWFGKDGRAFPRLKRFLSEVQQGRKASTLWNSDEVGHNQEAKRETKSLFNRKDYFDTPKPIRLIMQIVTISSLNENDIVLDFFAGSSSTAQGVMEYNKENNKNFKYVLVQIPEPIDSNEDAFNDGYSFITDIGKERIRRAGDKIKAELAEKYQAQQQQSSFLEGEEIMNPDSIDIGFKVFKLDGSNLKKWQPDADDLETQLFDSVENFVEGRSELDVVFEIMLKYGIDLTLPVETFEAGGKQIHSVGLGALMICLDNGLDTSIAHEIVRLKEELGPEVIRVVFRDNGFTDDSAKTNIREILRGAGIDEIVSI